MTAGSLGLRSGSYGSLQQVQNVPLPVPVQITPPLSVRKPPKMYREKMFKEKESWFRRIYKFVARRIQIMFVCLVSTAVLLLVLSVAKGNINIQTEGQASMNDTSSQIIEVRGVVAEGEVLVKDTSSQIVKVQEPVNVPPPPPKTLHRPLTRDYFHGYELPPEHPCRHFVMPPPPADKKRTGPRPCPVCYLPLEDAISYMPKAPSFSPVLKELTYIHEDNLTKSEFGGSEFGGYPSLRQRDDSYDIRESMSMHCGFVRGTKPGRQTGFDIDDSNLLEMDSCRGVVVASAIFGAFDYIRQPKNMSEYTKRNVCFHMFVDEETEAFLRKTNILGSDRKVGLWRIIVVQNLPYSDPRRNGKVPKLLLHRLFPNARYSLWVDAKLELVVDPFQILERFLWRQNASFAISRHYRRFDVFVEAEANKAANKYNNASIDFQIDFYKKEGLTPYSEEKLPITSDVPEGCVILREHIPISNLFTCLWFNEVDRFTSRDQISFSTVRDKIHSKTNYTINMFWDCERRNFVIQGYHRGVKDDSSPPPHPRVVHPPPLPPSIMNTDSQKTLNSNPVKNVTTRRGRDRRSRRHRKIITDSTEANTNSNFVQARFLKFAVPSL